MYAGDDQKWDVSSTDDFMLPIVLDFQEQNFNILAGYDKLTMNPL